jgi:hypothetical protein
MNNDHVYITCFNSDKNRINDDYTEGHDNVHVLPRDVYGPHCTPVSHALLGNAKAIPLNLMLAPGMLVKLTVNIYTDHGLVNNARGRVIDIVYPPTPDDVAEGNMFGSYPGRGNTCIVMVELYKYTGPHISADLPQNLVPIVPMTARCEKMCCFRKGFPLRIAKADSAHCYQGAQVGLLSLSSLFFHNPSCGYFVSSGRSKSTSQTCYNRVW